MYFLSGSPKKKLKKIYLIKKNLLIIDYNYKLNTFNFYISFFLNKIL